MTFNVANTLPFDASVRSTAIEKMCLDCFLVEKEIRRTMTKGGGITCNGVSEGHSEEILLFHFSLR